MKRPILLTARLALLPHDRERDVARLLPVLGDPEVMQHIGAGALTRLEVEAYLDRHETYWKATGMGGWTIERRLDGAVLGNIFLKPMSHLPEIEVGYSLGKPFWGVGFGTESLSEVLRYAREERGFLRVVAVVRAANLRSAALLRRCGFQLEGEREIDGKRREFYVAAFARA